MKFKSYSEIENSYNGKFVRELREQGFDDPNIEYVCENKIDGSNFQCSLDENDNFIVGKRSQLLGRDDTFQNYRKAMQNEDVENKLRLIKANIAQSFPVPEKFVFTVYGELCGGMYRHPDVEKVKNAQRIQGRIDYHPDNMWIPFDMAIRAPGDENKILYLLDQDDVVRYCKLVGLPYPIILFRGTLDACLNFPVEFIDKTGNILWNLPVIDENISEGVVIKPNHACWMRNGQRVILKNKNERFKERTCKGPKEKKENIPLTELETKYFNLAEEFITESRMMSVVSKIGELNEKLFGLFLGSFLKDLWNDFDKEYADEVHELEENTSVDEFSFPKIKKHISKEVSDFIRPKFVELINADTTIEDC